jgi:hypothetical protein
VTYEWDPEKATSNLGKHGIDFADAVTALEDPFALTLRDDDPTEERFVTVGVDALGRLLVLVYSWRGESVRVISARKATRNETRTYETMRP